MVFTEEAVRHVEAEESQGVVALTAKILTYSRSKGLFAGIELKGAVLKPDYDGNKALYGKRITLNEFNC